MSDQPIDQPSAEDQIKADAKKSEDALYHVVILEERDPNAKWYVVHTYSGHEEKVAQQLGIRINGLKLKTKVHEVMVPVQDKIKIFRGKKIQYKDKLFPGYLLIRMIMDDESWAAVRNTRGITGFVGIGKNPTPIPQTEVDTIKKYSAQAAPSFKASFTVGEAVKVIEGPFTEFLGTISEIDETKGKVKILVSIFGRETPVELDFLQVAKI